MKGSETPAIILYNINVIFDVTHWSQIYRNKTMNNLNSALILLNHNTIIRPLHLCNQRISIQMYLTVLSTIVLSIRDLRKSYVERILLVVWQYNDLRNSRSDKYCFPPLHVRKLLFKKQANPGLLFYHVHLILAL